ncbi:homeobox protein vent1-like [Acropora palmata]|uniref:homeobox protein vent1-like n=1 Tax=Acropora palmata TaxID=6131 RepID=UPI003DA10251
MEGVEKKMEGQELWKQNLPDLKYSPPVHKPLELKTDELGKKTCLPIIDCCQFPQYAERIIPPQSNFAHDSKSKPSHVQKAVKSRSSFSLEQIMHLERVFEQQKYLGSRDRKKISDQLQMTETQVKTWFQNRRMKQKRKQAEDVERRAKLAFISNLAHNMNHGYQVRPYPPPSYSDTPLILRHDLKPEYGCPPALPWNSQLPRYSPPPPYWASFPGLHPPQP